MKIRYLACAQQSFSCQNGHVSTNLILIIIASLIPVCLIGIAIDRSRRSRGLPPLGSTPRKPADISPLTAALMGSAGERSYYPRGITAVTPSGIRVSVRCPHSTGHRSPGLAVACGQREKARIQATGR